MPEAPAEPEIDPCHKTSHFVIYLNHDLNPINPGKFDMTRPESRHG
jgi:hypothetical protein